jgi:cytochrome P450
LPQSENTAAQVDCLPYLEAIVKELLRFWGPVPRQTRIPTRPVTISGQLIPPKTPVLVSFYAMNHMTEKWGSDAASFHPERWLGSPEARAFGGGKNRYAFSTFSHGARACIGQKFAHYEILVFLAGLVGRFEWKFADIFGLLPGTVRVDHASTVMLKVTGN